MYVYITSTKTVTCYMGDQSSHQGRRLMKTKLQLP